MASSRTYKDTLHQVLDIEGYYNIASEYLEGTKRRKRVISWSDAILCQRDIAHRHLFTAILTYRSVFLLQLLVIRFPFIPTFSALLCTSSLDL